MGLKLGVIMLEGNHIEDVPRILKAFGLSVEDAIVEVDSAETMEKQAGRTHYGVALYGHWTVILDPEMWLLASDEETCAELSRRYNGRLAGATLYGVSGSYWFWMLDKGQSIRKFTYNSPDIDADEGEPLAGEAGREDEWPSEKVLRMVQGLGVKLVDLHKPSPFALEEADRFFVCRSLEAAQERGSASSKTRRRPWWRFWR